MKTVLIKCQKPYDVYIDEFILSSTAFQNFCHRSQPNILITDETVGAPYKDLFIKKFDFDYIEIPSGEQFKTREMKQLLEDKLLQKGYGKNARIFALGGGVVLDLVGFLAATYCRGIEVIYIPTTLLAMVDVVVGGKTAVNTAYSKNSIGGFYTPSSVWIHLDVLNTLDEDQFTSGLMEVIKHALLFDKTFLFWLKEHIIEIVHHKNVRLIAQLILRSIELKANIVEQDEHEKGPRKLLNFGHTIGHAIEHVSEYKVLHGHAIGLGMLLEAYIANPSSEVCGLLRYFLETIDYAFDRLILEKKELLLEAMSLDKKNSSQEIHMVLLPELSQFVSNEGHYTFPISYQQINEALDWYVNT